MADDPESADSRRWLRELGALLALPAMWVDHTPDEICTGLLSVLFGVLRVDAAYARFDDPRVERESVEAWRPAEAAVPDVLRTVLERPDATGPGIVTADVSTADGGVTRVTRLPLALPWGTALVLTAASRPDFPDQLETHLLRVAVSQAAIAIHTARRLAHEHDARMNAEAALVRQGALLRSLVDEVQPSLESAVARIQVAARSAPEVAGLDARPEAQRADAPERTALPGLSHREVEVLGLLAQGLSNKEIAGLLWLSDRTVERHVTSLYRKIGVGRRSEATAFALRHGLA